MKLTNLRNIILKENSLFNRKVKSTTDLDNDLNYNKEGVRGIIGFAGYGNDIYPENYDLPNAFTLLDNGTTLYINSQLILESANAKWASLRIDFDKLFIDNPVFGGKIKKLKIGFLGESNSKRLDFKITPVKDMKSVGTMDISHIDNITIEYENTNFSEYPNPKLYYIYKFGSNVKLINILCYYDKTLERVGDIFDTKDPNNFVINCGIRTELTNHIPHKKLDTFWSLSNDFKSYNRMDKFYRILENPNAYDLLLTSGGNFKTFKFELPFSTGSYDKVDYVMIRVKDSSMENKIKSNYLNYYNKIEVFKYEDYGIPKKKEDPKEVQKIEKKYGYFVIFSQPKY